MAKVAESMRLVDDIVRLRRAERVPEAAADVGPVRADLEARLGRTLSRSRASSIVGVSQTAFDRWVRAGRIPTVLSPGGRVEVPTRFVLETAELINELKREGHRRHLLAAALRHRAATADGVPDSIAPRRAVRRRPSVPRGHLTAEERSLAYHRVLAGRLDERLVDEARRRIETLLGQGHIDPRSAERWREVLSCPLSEIAATITDEGQEGRDLRQNTPFAGVLNERERRRIIDAVR